MKAAFAKLPLPELTSIRARRLSLPIFDSTYHFHPEIELCYTESGVGRLLVGDAIKPFGPGDLVLLGPNVPHSYYMAPTDSCGPDWARSTVVQFRQDAFGAGFFELPDLQAIRQLLSASTRGLRFHEPAVEPIAATMSALVGAAGATRIAALLNVLDQLTRLHPAPISRRTIHPELRFSDMDRMDRVVALVHHRFHESLSLDEAAKTAAMTPEAFCRFFKRTTGRTFTRFVNEIRIAESCRLLIESDRTVSDIAFACGFGTISHFHQRFLQSCQLTPRLYRQQARAR